MRYLIRHDGWCLQKHIFDEKYINILLDTLIAPYRNIPKPVWIISLSLFVNRVGSMFIAFMSLYLTKELGFSMSAAGIVMGAYGLGSIAGSYIGGWLTDRFDHKKIMVYSSLLSGLLMVPIAFWGNIYMITLNVFVYTVVADIFRPASNVAVSNYTTDTNRTQAISLLRLMVNLGFGIGPAIGGLGAIWFGYKSLFLFDATTSFLAGIIILLMLPISVNEITKVKRAQLNITKASSAIYDRAFLLFLFLVAVYGTLFFQLFASVPVYFSKDFHMSEDIIGYLLGLNGLLVVLIEMPLIYRIQNYPHINRLIAVGCLMMAVAYGLLALHVNSIFIFVIYTLFITMSEIFAMPFMMNYALSKPTKERQGQYIGLYSISYGIAHVAAPNFGLGIADHFSFPALYLLAVVLSLGLCIIFYKWNSLSIPKQQ